MRVRVFEDSTKIGLPGNRPVELVGLQILRGLAAALVVVNHLPIEDRFIEFGAAGVDIFFVISGFIILHTSYPTGRPPQRPSQFAAKRISRIYPFYWFCLIVTLGLWTVGLFHTLKPTPQLLIESFFLWPSSSGGIIGVSWTLSYEVYFYVLFLLSLFLQNRQLSLLLVSSSIVGLLIIGSSNDTSSFLGNPIVCEFCFGMCLAYAWSVYKIRGSKILSCAAVAGFILMCWAPFWIAKDYEPLPSVRWAVWGVPAVLIVAAFLTVRETNSTLQRMAVLIGDASYAIYLTHPFVMITYRKLARDQSASVEAAYFSPVLFIVSLAVGTAAYYFIERHLIAADRKLLAVTYTTRAAHLER